MYSNLPVSVRVPEWYEITVPPYWVCRAKEFAQKIIKTSNRRSQATKFHKKALNGGQDFPARLAEIAACIFYGIDPEKLKWDAEKPDAGYDIKLNGWLVDVKSSEHPAARNVIWPLTDLDSFDRKNFNVLLGTKVIAEWDGALAWVTLFGVIEKSEFREKHVI